MRKIHIHTIEPAARQKSRPPGLGIYCLPEGAVRGAVQETAKLAVMVENQINEGLVPVVLLPDSAVRNMGILLGNVLPRLFPQVYGIHGLLSQHSGGLITNGVLFLPVTKWEKAVELPEALLWMARNYPGYAVVIADDNIHVPNDANPITTIGLVELELKTRLPNVRLSAFNISTHRALNVSWLYDRKFSTSEGVYKVNAGILRRYYYFAGADRDNLLQTAAMQEDYERVARQSDGSVNEKVRAEMVRIFWQEKDLKHILYGLAQKVIEAYERLKVHG